MMLLENKPTPETENRNPSHRLNEDVSPHEITDFHLTNSIEDLMTQLAKISNGSVSIDLYANYNVPQYIKGSSALVKSILLSLILKTSVYSKKKVITILMSSQPVSDGVVRLMFKFIGVESHDDQRKIGEDDVSAARPFDEFIAEIDSLKEVVRENDGQLVVNYEKEFFKNIELVLPFHLGRGAK